MTLVLATCSLIWQQKISGVLFHDNSHLEKAALKPTECALYHHISIESLLSTVFAITADEVILQSWEVR